MSTLPEIEAAIRQLPEQQVEELSKWLEQLRVKQVAPVQIDAWLKTATGAALSGVTTDAIMATTRGDE